MIIWREGVVGALGPAWPGAVELTVTVAGDPIRALAYPELVGAVQVGDRVLVTTAALERGLGTGGYGFVAAVPDRLPADPPAPPAIWSRPGIRRCRRSCSGPTSRTPRIMTCSVRPTISAGLPVVVADLHSALPAIVAGVRSVRPEARVVYVMTDGGALPLWFSRTVAGLRDAGWLTASVTVGQAFGGDVEAVSLHSGLLAARLVLGADVVVVSQGPGNLGTGTRWGFSGVAAGDAVNAVATLGGRAVACLRVSAADPRPRHHGISHHSLTAYGRVALAPADVVVPVLDGDLGRLVEEQADAFPTATSAGASRRRRSRRGPRGVTRRALDDGTRLRGGPDAVPRRGRGRRPRGGAAPGGLDWVA